MEVFGGRRRTARLGRLLPKASNGRTRSFKRAEGGTMGDGELNLAISLK